MRHRGRGFSSGLHLCVVINCACVIYARSAWASFWILLMQNKMAAGQDSSLLNHQLFLIKAKKFENLWKIYFEKDWSLCLSGICRLQNTEWWDHNVDLTKVCLHRSVLAPLCLLHFVTAVPVGFMFYRSRKLWLMCNGTIDNSSMARKALFKAGIENFTVYFDHILNTRMTRL